MGKGGYKNGHKDYPTYTWDEVGEHTHMDDKWIVVNDDIYDITHFSKKHPGGARLISHFAGQDATDAWTAFHDHKDMVSKYMKPIKVGTLCNDKQVQIKRDFRKLREKAEEMDLFKVKTPFYLAHIGHIIALEVIGYLLLKYYGIGWGPWLLAAAILATAQAQSGWSQHDYGHLSVFPNSKLNHLMHHFVIGTLKGASSNWWNHRHYQHHAKPNVALMDPDISLPYVFILGKRLARVWGEKKREGFLPYQFQHIYYFVFGPPLLLPTYFHFENIYFVIKRKLWGDLFATVSFFVRWFVCYGPLLGGWGAFWFYMLVRSLESHWFVWVTQMSHISMEIEKDQQADWFTSQLKSTCNVHPSLFNDWFTGHLNFQIEHHLFPTMPRHNYIKIKPHVEAMAKKHGIPYVSKTLYRAFADIPRSLQEYGELWYDAFHTTG
ncbi:unnamed protein product [Owenia fusiformis]|uniref:Uncharacterized protein n=1 Tax=Owenia fusiformis TaxID=6347 RepID=A0A8J1UL72_OWEFU|nr:unnamed protein product [Owenia fusiformis]